MTMGRILEVMLGTWTAFSKQSPSIMCLIVCDCTAIAALEDDLLIHGDRIEQEIGRGREEGEDNLPMDRTRKRSQPTNKYCQMSWDCRYIHKKKVWFGTSWVCRERMGLPRVRYDYNDDYRPRRRERIWGS
ncbi:hypothetical protein B296_00033448 [Ensete ventricosum]|uniref:Uncharacterized protein n=1 Tax=Ensete ventricosum TaxID=4639 RepID=A0A426YPQ6_ENSVE|nr:hypothetical protein B296_00033448 [Ensete ventricosum]